MKPSFKNIPFTGLILLLPIMVYAQVSEKENLMFESYTIEHGLPDNEIRAIAQDQPGYLWVGTEGGLSRYDGYTFTNYFNDPDDPQTISSDRITSILCDQKGHVWIGTQSGLNRYDADTDTFIRYITNPYDTASLPDNFIHSIFEASDGNLWLATGGGLARYNRANDSFTTWLPDPGDPNSLSHVWVTAIAEDDKGYLYIATRGGGVNILNPDTGEFSHLRHDPDDPAGLLTDFILNLFIDTDQVLWVNYSRAEVIIPPAPPVGQPTGLWKKDLRSGISERYLYNPGQGYLHWVNIRDFLQTADGNLWMAHTGGVPVNGLRLYNREKDAFSEYLHDPQNPFSISWSFATALFEDRFGNLWAGTSRGLSKADRKQSKFGGFRAFPENPNDQRNNVDAILEVRENKFWLGTAGQGVLEWNPNTNSFSTITGFRPFIYMRLIDENTVWYRISNLELGRISIDSHEVTVFKVESTAYPDLHLYDVHVHAIDSLLLQTNQGSFVFEISTTRFSKIDIPSRPVLQLSVYVSNEILTRRSNNNYWLLSNNGSIDTTASSDEIVLAELNLVTGELNYIDRDSSYLTALGHGIVNHLMEDSRGNLWISKSNGLAFYDPAGHEFRFYNQKQGLNYLNVLNTLEDDQGNIWLSTRYGISRFNPEEERFRNFGKADGLLLSRMNPGSFYKRENGEMLFGGVGGINYFHPDNIRTPAEPPLIHITNASVAGEPVNLSAYRTGDNSIPVNWSSNRIDFEFVSVNFRNPEQTTYAYKLEGFDGDWVESGSRRFTQYSNLSPGTYTFKVRATNAESIQSVGEASLSIRVLPPFWRTWWAYGLYVFLFAGGVFAVDRHQRRKLIQRERERAREKELAQAREIERAYKNLEIAHENLKSAQDQLVQQEKLASLGQLTAGIAHEIKNPLNFVNNFSDLSLELLSEARDEVKSNLPTPPGRGAGDEGEKGEDPSLILQILDDIEANLRKIHEHGSRADGIVKSMLQHSRGGDGKMEPTPLNPLIKEYVNLAFHGMRAGNEPIDVDIDYQLDDSAGEVQLVAEDFSRVILNLCNNAFDAMRTLSAERSAQSESYSPKLAVSTKSENGAILIEVQDNGPGIPDEIKDKILQPFFTTKKGTQGTGLGLSITNDIVKAHGGNLDIHSRPGKTVLKITLIDTTNA
jgi:signal transduction histidine kinase/ligand-binding sensor domain-containing protein